MATAFSYVRFSTRQQAKGGSLKRQLDWAEDLCKAKGWELDTSLHLQDLGVSAFRGKNADVGALAGFLEAVKRKRVRPGNILIVESLDRLTREVIQEALTLFLSILQTGVEIKTREPDRHYTKESDAFAIMEAIIYMERSNNESKTKSMRGLAHWKQARAKSNKVPLHNLCPAWLRLSEDRQKFEVIPEAAKAIKQIYKWAGAGLGLNPITARLNKEGIPPIGRADSWRRSYVSKLIRDKSVVGHYQPHVMKDGKRVPVGYPVKDYFPPIISENEWYRVRQAVKERGKETGPKGDGIASLFTGLIHDARDGQTMHLCYAGSSHKSNTRVLVSYGVRNGEKGSIYRPFPYDPIERGFLESIRELSPADVLDEGVDDRQEEIAALMGKVGELDGKIARVQRRVMDEEGIDTLMTLLERLDKERKVTAANLEALKAEEAHRQPTALTETQSLIGMLENAKGEGRKDLRIKIKSRIRQLVESMWMLVWDVTQEIRAAELQVVLHSGKVWGYLFAWLHRRGGPYHERGLTTGIGLMLAPPGPQTAEETLKFRQERLDRKGKGFKAKSDPIPLLSEYRLNPKTKRFFTWHHKESGPAIQRLIDAEIKARKAMADVEKLKDQ